MAWNGMASKLPAFDLLFWTEAHLDMVIGRLGLGLRICPEELVHLLRSSTK